LARARDHLIAILVELPVREMAMGINHGLFHPLKPYRGLA
jgi:hypothetical protein